MNTKFIITGLLVLLLVFGGGWLYFLRDRANIGAEKGKVPDTTNNSTYMDVNTPGNVHGSEASYGAPLDYKENVPVIFADFSLTFLGAHDVVLEDGQIVSLQTNDYMIEDHSKKQQVLKIGNGQLPNPPTDFSVGDKHFTVWTGVGPDGALLAGETLIVKQK